jgi:ankyrin repeat protein
MGNKNGFTSIMVACLNGHLATAKKLYKLGAKADIESETGKFCLKSAA